MNTLSIEKARTELLNVLEYSSSRRLKLKSISEFFSLLLNQESSNLIESYLPEFIPKYIDYLKSYSSFGIKPEFSQAIISTNERLINLNELNEFRDKLSLLNDQLKNKLQELQNILIGKEILQAAEQKILFPVINEWESIPLEDEQIDGRWVLGSLDSLTIKISITKDQDKFIVVPSEIEKDKKLEEQINISWLKAKEYCKSHVKRIAAHHEVIISFDEHLGIYKGESVGTALAIGFIEEILRFYNSQTILKPIGNAAFTGGVKEDGDINPVSKEIAGKKVEIAFYSNCSTLAVPKEDENYAVVKLEELKKQYPLRKLKVVGVKDLDEILLRRDLIEIKKQKLVVRTGKFVKKNWVSAIVTVLLAILFGYLFVVDFDDNPAILATDGGTLFVKNKNGKLLWTKKVGFPQDVISNNKILFSTSRIVNVNNDGINEVVYCGNIKSTNLNIQSGSEIVCYSYKGDMLWTYTFPDTVNSEREKLESFYGINLILDTITINNKKSLLANATNANSFSSAIFRLDLRSGKRLPGTLWCSGFTVDGLIKDVDNDGKRDILAVGVDNGFEDIVIFAFDIDTLTSVRPSTKEYTIKGFPPAKLKTYIRLAKTDYDNYLGIRMSGIEAGRFYDDISESKYVFQTTSSNPEKPARLWIKLDYNLKDFDVIVDNQYQVIRDSLVAHGKLNLPYTDTKEYVDIYKSKILYWKNGKWVKREELE